MHKKALIVIDAQNDYLPDGKFPLWNMEATLHNIGSKIKEYTEAGNPVILVQHLSPKGASFFEEGSEGAELIPEIKTLLTDPIIVIKRHGDAFDETELTAILEDQGVSGIELCGMMTQNCVLFTALSERAKKYKPTILSGCSTSTSPVIHAVALRGLSRILDVK